MHIYVIVLLLLVLSINNFIISCNESEFFFLCYGILTLIESENPSDVSDINFLFSLERVFRWMCARHLRKH